MDEFIFGYFCTQNFPLPSYRSPQDATEIYSKSPAPLLVPPLPPHCARQRCPAARQGGAKAAAHLGWGRSPLPPGMTRGATFGGTCWHASPIQPSRSDLPSNKLTMGNHPFCKMGKTTINRRFSIAMLNYRRVFGGQRRGSEEENAIVKYCQPAKWWFPATLFCHPSCTTIHRFWCLFALPNA